MVVPEWFAHAWSLNDILLKRCLNSMLWFPPFLAKTKQLIKFFRDYATRDLFSKYLIERGERATAKMVKMAKLAAF